VKGVSQAPGSRSLRGSGIKGSLWTLGGHGASQLVRFASNILLSRLLFPAVFGQVALVYTFLTALQLFSDVGTTPAIVQNPRGDDPRFLRTAWTVTCVRGVVLWGASWLVAIPAAAFYDQPMLRWLIPGAAFSAVLTGCESTAIAQSRRHLRFERITLMELASQVLGTMTTVVLALGFRKWLGPSDPRAVWAIVAGGNAYGLARLVLSHTVLHGISHRFELDREALASLVRFGRWVLLSTLLSFLSGPADRLVFGKLVPIAVLGVYGIASTLALVPTDAVLKVGSGVVFPAFSRASMRSDFNQIFPKVRMPLILGGAMIVSGLLAAGPVAVSILYDARYRDAGWMVQILAVASWFQILENTNGAMLLATGRSDWMAAGNGVKLTGMLVFIPFGFMVGGFAGALAGLVVAEALRYLVSALAIRRRGLHVLGNDVGLTFGVGGVAAMGYGAGFLTSGWTESRVLALVAATTPCVAVWAGLGLLYWSRRPPGVLERTAPPA
jgi:O-antigen/teichoic acid export membrane protein